MLAIFLSIKGHQRSTRLLSTEISDVIPLPARSVPGPTRQPVPVVVGESVMLFGAAGTDILRWIKDTTNLHGSRRDLTITIYDPSRMTTTDCEMHDCLVSQVTFPALDKSASDSAVIRLAVKPQSLSVTERRDVKTMPLSDPYKPWSVRDFAFSIEGLEDGRHAQKIDSLNIKQFYKSLYVSQSRSPTIEPTKIQEGNIVFSLPLATANGVLNWQQQSVQGDRDRRTERSGSITYLSTDNKVVATVNLKDLILVSAGISGHTVRVEMAVQRLDLETTTAFGT